MGRKLGVENLSKTRSLRMRGFGEKLKKGGKEHLSWICCKGLGSERLRVRWGMEILAQ
jgi:hypothetical protein